MTGGAEHSTPSEMRREICKTYSTSSRILCPSSGTLRPHQMTPWDTKKLVLVFQILLAAYFFLYNTLTMQRIDGVMWSGFIIKSTKCFEINVYYQDYLEKWLLHMFMVKSVSVRVKNYETIADFIVMQILKFHKIGIWIDLSRTLFCIVGWTCKPFSKTKNFRRLLYMEWCGWNSAGKEA